MTDREGDYEIYSMNADGTRLEKPIKLNTF